MRAIGYKISVSISGSSYVDFSRFAALAPDIIKVDATRQEGVSVLATQRHGLERAAEWCAENGRDLIVEGVERDEERNRLMTVGCKLFQDCLFTHPGRKLSRA